MTNRPGSLTPLLRALDEARFGRARTLDLRAGLPSAADAEARAEAWLRELQAQGGGEVLIITGRGRGSEGGVAVVRPAIQRRLARLRRQGVISSVHEHSPGSFVVELAPLHQMLNAPSRSRDNPRRKSRRSRQPAESNAAWQRGLSERTISLLRELATLSLEGLGTRELEPLIEAEMQRHLTRLSVSIPAGADRDQRLQMAIRAVLDELTDA